MNARTNLVPPSRPAPGRPRRRHASVERRSPSHRARERSRSATAPLPPAATLLLSDLDDNPFQAGLLDDDFDRDDDAVVLQDAVALARLLLHEENEAARFC